MIGPTKSARAELDSTSGVDVRAESQVTSTEAAYDAELHAHADRARDSIESLRRLLTARRIQFGTSALPTSIKPHFIRRSDSDEWTGLLGQLLSVMETTAEQLRTDPDFRKHGPFGPAAWELLDIDPGFKRTSIVCRPDVVWDGTRIGLLEMNADSPAMMLFADMVQELQRELFPMAEIDRSRDITYERRIPALLESLIATYREWGGQNPSPVIAIVDWPDQKTSQEQEELAAAFTRLGTRAFTCSPDQLTLQDGRLLGRGQPIDIIQRRLLFPDIVRRRAELEPFLTAYRERMVCVINPLRSYLVGCKAILAELCRRERAGELPEQQRIVVQKVLPCTALPGQLAESELDERTRWVLKPIFGSGGTGVVIGRYADKMAWKEALRVVRQGGWVIQAFLPIPLYRVPLTTASGHAMIPLYANWNPFFFGGKAAGGIARVSSDPVVGISARGALLPSVIVNGE